MTPPTFTFDPAAPLTPEVQAAFDAAVDRRELRVMELVYYVAGGLTAFISCFFLLHFAMFLFFGLNPRFFDHPHSNQTPPPPGLFLGMAAVVGLVILLGWSFGAAQIYAGRCLKKRQHRLFVQIVAGVECLFLPWGTLIGVFTFLLLNRPTVRALFPR